MLHKISFNNHYKIFLGVSFPKCEKLMDDFRGFESHSIERKRSASEQIKKIITKMEIFTFFQSAGLSQNSEECSD